MLSKRRGPSTTRQARIRLLVVGGCLLGALVPASAQAESFVNMSVTLAGGTAVRVGEPPLTGHLSLTNSSNGDEGRANLEIIDLTIVPTCGRALAGAACDEAGAADPGVIRFAVDPANPVGTGACNGKAFTFDEIAADTSRIRLNSATPINFGVGQTCTIPFIYTVAKMAANDIDGAPGTQTEMVVFGQSKASFNGVETPHQRWKRLTVQRDTPDFITRASDGILVGGGLSVATTITGTAPGGFITFKLFRPDDPTCLSSTFETKLPVAGNGTYRTPAVVATEVGTYRWTASYDGDLNNDIASSGCGDAAAATVVSAPPPPPPTATPPPPAGPTGPATGGTTPGVGGTTPGVGGTTPGTGVKRVRLDAFALTRRTFARASRTTVLAANAAYVAPAKRKKATAKGTTIKYTLSAPAAVTMVVERITQGRRAGGYANTCVKATAKLKKQKAKVCTLYTKVSTLKRVHKSGGAKKVSFSGRAGKRVLPAGRYRIRAKAAAGAGTASAERKTTFKIVKR